jgi:hypothetical protein
MRRVAAGDATKPELQRFQTIIDQITNESRKKGTPGPSADRLLVDSRTVQYFADEVHAILDIVLRSNPRQTSAGLRPPEGSDPLVVSLVKSALDETRTRDMVRRIAENKPNFSDAMDLKGLLDKLKSKLQPSYAPSQSPAPSAMTTPTMAKPNGIPLPPQAAQQALRSKGPPPGPRHDVSAVVFEFSGGTGDRYLFPKFSILEYAPIVAGAGQGQGQQVIASFLIVRRGSAADYPVADPALDYYQPATVRLFTQTGRHLEHLARVVAPQDEVKRYMDDIMHRMTRAEYVLLAMRLPRGDEKSGGGSGSGSGKEEGSSEEKSKDKEAAAAAKKKKDSNGGACPAAVLGATETFRFVNSHAATVNGPNGPQGAGLWTATTRPRPGDGYAPNMEFARGTYTPLAAAEAKDDQYQTFIASVSRREPEEVA